MQLGSFTWRGCFCHPDRTRWRSRWRCSWARLLSPPLRSWRAQTRAAHPRPRRWSWWWPRPWRGPSSRSGGWCGRFPPGHGDCTAASFHSPKAAKQRQKRHEEEEEAPIPLITSYSANIYFTFVCMNRFCDLSHFILGETASLMNKRRAFPEYLMRACKGS